jgi:hypothetical protein
MVTRLVRKGVEIKASLQGDRPYMTEHTTQYDLDCGHAWSVYHEWSI